MVVGGCSGGVGARGVGVSVGRGGGVLGIHAWP